MKKLTAVVILFMAGFCLLNALEAVNPSKNGADSSEIVVGTGNELLRVPIDLYFKSSLFETLYYPSEMQNLSGLITGMKFYSNLPGDLTNIPVRAWIGTTSLSDLASGWIPASQLCPVFDSMLDLPSGEQVVEITFDEPFLYLGDGNLVLMVHRPLGSAHSSSNQFRGQTQGSNRARKAYSDATHYDPENPPANSTLSGEFPKTAFIFEPIEAGLLRGTVHAADGFALANTLIEALDTDFSTLTNYEGIFNLPLPVGTYSIKATTAGYPPQTAEGIVINSGQTTYHSFVMSVENSDPAQTPQVLALNAGPNPFKSSVLISFELKQPQALSLDIFGLRGQKVRALASGVQNSGSHTFSWDGRDDQGKPLPSGIYFCRLQSVEGVQTLKLLMLK